MCLELSLTKQVPAVSHLQILYISVYWKYYSICSFDTGWHSIINLSCIVFNSENLAYMNSKTCLMRPFKELPLFLFKYLKNKTFRKKNIVSDFDTPPPTVQQDLWANIIYLTSMLDMLRNFPYFLTSHLFSSGFNNHYSILYFNVHRWIISTVVFLLTLNFRSIICL